MKKTYFLVTLIFYSVAIFYLAITTPISPHEAKIFYTSTTLLSTLMHWGDAVIHIGFLGFRSFFIFFGFITLGLFYILSKVYFRKEEDRYLSTFLFMLLPGTVTAITLVNIAIIVLPLVLLFVLFYEKGYFYILPFFLLALFFIHESSIIFFIAIFLYGLIHKDIRLTILSSTFLLAFLYLAKGIKISGYPSGHFIEIFGLYATLFSPLVFLYFFYALYRILLREKKTLIWYISFTALAFSLLLSIRQRVDITDFAPYVMIAMVLMLNIFNHSVKVRLPLFQKNYKRGFYSVVFILVLSFLLIVFHQLLFTVISDTQKHFANRIYTPYHLAKSLKKKSLSCYDGMHGRARYQLFYYGIDSCRNPM